MNIRLQSLIQGIIAGVSFGSASIFIRLLVQLDVNVYTIAVYRVFIASIALLLISYFFMRKDLVRTVGSIPKYKLDILVMGFTLGLHFIFFISAVRDTLIVNATVLVNTVPLITLVTGVILFKTKVRIREVLAILVGFLGVITIALPDLRSVGNLVGDLEAIIAAFLEALYLNIGSRIRRHFNPIVVMIPVYLTSALTIFVCSYATLNRIYIPINVSSIILILAVALIPTAIGHTLFISSLKGLKSHETATLALLEPVSATILALFIFLEIPSTLTIVGSILIFTSVILISAE